MPSTLPSSGFTEAVNAAGEKQLVPRAWLEPGHRFAGQFRLPPSAARRAGTKTPAGKTGGSTTETPPSGDDKKE